MQTQTYTMLLLNIITCHTLSYQVYRLMFWTDCSTTEETRKMESVTSPQHFLIILFYKSVSLNVVCSIQGKISEHSPGLVPPKTLPLYWREAGPRSSHRPDNHPGQQLVQEPQAETEGPDRGRHRVSEGASLMGLTSI